MKRYIQIATIIFLLLGIVLSIPNTDWSKSTSIYGFASVCCGALGSIISLFIPSKYEFLFEINDWIYIDGVGYSIVISYKKHKISKSPNCEMFFWNGENYQSIMGGIIHDNEGNITISSAVNRRGKLVIM